MREGGGRPAPRRKGGGDAADGRPGRPPERGAGGRGAGAPAAWACRARRRAEGPDAARDEELRELRREAGRPGEKNGFLRKAASFFAGNQAQTR